MNLAVMLLDFEKIYDQPADEQHYEHDHLRIDFFLPMNDYAS